MAMTTGVEPLSWFSCRSHLELLASRRVRLSLKFKQYALPLSNTEFEYWYPKSEPLPTPAIAYTRVSCFFALRIHALQARRTALFTTFWNAPYLPETVARNPEYRQRLRNEQQPCTTWQVVSRVVKERKITSLAREVRS